MNKTVTDAIKDRRSVRKYKDVEIDPEKVKKCIENATLAPNSMDPLLETHLGNKYLARGFQWMPFLSSLRLSQGSL